MIGNKVFYSLLLATALFLTAPGAQAAIIQDFENPLFWADLHDGGAGDWAFAADNGPSFAGIQALFKAGASQSGAPIYYTRTLLIELPPNANTQFTIDYKGGNGNGVSAAAALIKAGSHPASQVGQEYQQTSGNGWNTWSRLAVSKEVNGVGTWDNNWHTSAPVNLNTTASGGVVTVAFFFVVGLGSQGDAYFDNLQFDVPGFQDTPTPTQTLLPDDTPTPTLTPTVEPATPTATPIPETPTPTETPVPDTPTPTETPEIDTPTPTPTEILPTATETEVPTPTATALPATPTPTQVISPTATPDVDLNNDGVIDQFDLFLFMEQWHETSYQTP